MSWKWLLLTALGFSLLYAFSERRLLNMHIYVWGAPGIPPPLLDAGDEGPGVDWLDDYFTIELVAPGSYAIGEPRYAQQNYSYLLVGSERAVLFDAGPGIRDVRATAESLTNLPITFLPSHFHYDHVGNSVTFDHIALPDLPYLRARAEDNVLALTAVEHLGAAEGFAAPIWSVDEWWAPGTRIDLGGRTLELLYTPGHTTDSISLFDAAAGTVFSGDYLYPGYLYGFLPNSSMGEYLATANNLLARLPAGTVFFGAHRDAPPGAPKLTLQDLVDLQRGLDNLRAGELQGAGIYPVVYPFSERLSMLAEPRWLQNWRAADEAR